MRLLPLNEVDGRTDNSVLLVNLVNADGAALQPLTILRIISIAPGQQRLCRILSGDHAGRELIIPGPVQVLV